MRLIKANYDNYHLLREWRNENREYYIDQTYSTVAMHDQWFANFLKDKTQKLYLIKYDGKYVGCIGLVIEKDKLPEISRVLLADRRYARQGLMSEALSRLTNKYTPCYLQVRADNLRAIQFYLKNGFTIKPNSETVRNGITIINMIKEH